MPFHADGYLIPFSAPQIAAMGIETFDVRTGGHPTEVLRPDDRTMSRTWKVNWASRYDFAELCLGREVLWLDTSGGPGEWVLSRLMPDTKYGQHPDARQLQGSYISKMQGHGKGIDDADQMPEYEKAIVEVVYEVMPFELGDALDPSSGVGVDETTRFISLGDSTRSEAESFGPLPGGSFKCTNAAADKLHGRAAPYSASVVRPVERFTIWWHKLPWLLVGNGTTTGALFQRLYYGDPAYDTGDWPVPFLGCVNSDDFELTSCGQKWPAGTLLLEGVERQIHRSPFAEEGTAGLRMKVGFNVAYSPWTWLDLYVKDPAVPANSALYRMSVSGTYYAPNAMPDGAGLYNTRPFSDLFLVNFA